MADEDHKKYLAAKAKFAGKLAGLYPDVGEGADALFDRVARLDPTSQAGRNSNQRFAYLDWVCSRMVQSPPREQDFYKIHQDLSLYITLARLDKVRAAAPHTTFYKPYVQPDIGQYKTLQQLSETLLPYEDLKDRKKSAAAIDAERRNAEENSIILYDGPEGRIVSPQTMEASQYWGKGTKWCISATKSDNQFSTYHNDGETPVLMFLPKGTSEKFAFNENDNSSARNVLDVGVYDAEFKNEESIKRQAVLEKFCAVALNAPSFAQDAVSVNPALSKALSLFCLYHPPAYIQMLEHAGGQAIPAYMNPDKIWDMAKSSLDDDTQHFDKLQMQSRNFITHKDVLAFFCKDRTRGLEIIDYLEDMPSSFIKGTHMMGAVLGDMSFNGQSAQSKEDWISDYAHQADYVSYAAEAFSGFDEVLNAYTEKTVIKEYLDQVPPDFWDDEEFCMAMFNNTRIPYGMFMEIAPQVFNHPKPWLTRLDSTPDSDDLKKELSAPCYSHLPFTKVEGVPFLQLLLDAEDTPFYDLPSCQDLYDAFSDVDAVDWTPLAKKLGQLYPQGFEDVADLEAASNNMPKCDLSTLLEKSVARNPELFADVDPERQTMGMVTSAIKHNPECLADVATRFFNVEKRPPEMAAAFKRMVDMKSPYIGMVEHHFSSPSAPQPA